MLILTIFSSDNVINFQALKSKIIDSCKYAEDFVKLYYESADKRRHQMSKLYMDNGTYVWNGNAAVGKENIQKFYQELPPSEHNYMTVDAQPISDNAVSNSFTFLVQVSGTVKFQDSPSKAFQQTFMLTAQQEKWKIVNDCFRLQDGVCEKK